MVFKFTKEEKSWIMYDVANSAYVLLATTIIPILFASVAKSSLSQSEYLAYWAYAVILATLVIAFLSPILGAISDEKNKRKPMFITFLILGILGCFLQALMTSWLMFLFVFVITKIGFNTSIIFYDSMLPDITTKKRMDEISSHGYAWGYIGSCVPFVISIVFVMKGEAILKLHMDTIMLIVFSITGLWWLIFTIPLLKTYEQKHYVESRKSSAKTVFKRLFETVKEIWKNNKVKYFLLAFFFYIDGVYTIINMASAYGQSLGLDSSGLILALLATQIVAFPCAIFFGKISKRFKTENLIKITIIAYGLITLYGIQLKNLMQFCLLAILVGMFQGAIQALSRSYFAKIIPPEKSAEYFGIFDIFGKGASIFGTLILALVTSITGKQNLALIPLVVLFFAAYIAFDKCSKIKNN